MRRKLFGGFVAFLVVVMAFLLSGCKSEKERTDGFVYIEDGVFKVDGATFFPLMINYKVELRRIGDEVLVSPAIYYEYGDMYESNSKDEILQQFSNHIELIKEMGFNTVRICMDVVLSDDKGYYYKTNDGGVYLKESTGKILDGVEAMLSVAEEHDMRVMLLLKAAMNKELEDFTVAVLRRFADNPIIFAYDMMNEPLYFDEEKYRAKEDALSIVMNWEKMVRKNAPNHLFTIGFSEPIEVFEWDPSVLPVDFVQIHTYHPLRIPNEIWWYSHYVGKPWMIGETSLPSDNDSVSYDLQSRFVEEAYQYVIDCGGIGFGWWEFQDFLNPYMNFEANYSGLLNHDGVTVTKSGREVVGTLKPAAYKFAGLHELKPNKPVRPINYFNMVGYENYVIKGKIICQDKPVEGALIRGWNKPWRVGMNTYSDENGDFTLYSNDSCVHFEISAPGLTKVKFDRQGLKYHNVGGYDYSDLRDVALEYQKISYFPFLKNDTTLFEFKSGMFDKVKFVTDMGAIELKKLK